MRRARWRSRRTRLGRSPATCSPLPALRAPVDGPAAAGPPAAATPAGSAERARTVRPTRERPLRSVPPSGRLSSSRPGDKKCRQGFDTVSLHWPHQGGSEVLSALQAAPSFPTVAGGLLLADELPGGLRVAAWPQHGSVKVEG